MALDQYWDDDQHTAPAGLLGQAGEMSFLDHLEELRWHIIRALASVAVFSVLAFIFREEIFKYVILAPKDPNFWTYRKLCELGAFLHADGLCVTKIDFTLMSREVTGQFMMAMTYSFIIGLIFAFPYAFWELWRFIKPGLREREAKASTGAVFWVTMLFLMGAAFGYYVVAPLAINFLANFKIDESIINQFDISSYIELLALTVLACGVTFQLPMVVFVLSHVGILTPALMRQYRKHAFVVILIVAAIITPSADMFSQLLVAAPLTLLYEISIVVSARVNRRRRLAMAAAAAGLED